MAEDFEGAHKARGLTDVGSAEQRRSTQLQQMGALSGVCGLLGWTLPFDGGCCCDENTDSSAVDARPGQQSSGHAEIGTLAADLDCGGILCLNDSLTGASMHSRMSRSVILSNRPRHCQLPTSVSPTPSADDRSTSTRLLPSETQVKDPLSRFALRASPAVTPRTAPVDLYPSTSPRDNFEGDERGSAAVREGIHTPLQTS